MFRPHRIRALNMRFWSFLLVTVLLVGCAGGSGGIGFNRYMLNTPYGDDISYASAVAELTEQAIDICGEDYRKVHDYDTTQGSKRILVWEVGCRGVERTDARFGSSNWGISDKAQ